MSELLNSVIKQVESFLLEKGYSRSARDSFSKRFKGIEREEVIHFSERKGKRELYDYIYIGVTSSIYFANVNALDKKIIKDPLNSHPIISGSIGHYKKSDSCIISIPMNRFEQKDEVSKAIITNIQQGAFNLFKSYPDLNSIILGIEKNDEWLKNYTKLLDLRMSIRLAAIYHLVKSKEYAISWFDNSQIESDKKRKEIIMKMKREW